MRSAWGSATIAAMVPATPATRPLWKCGAASSRPHVLHLGADGRGVMSLRLRLGAGSGGGSIGSGRIL